MIVCAQCGGNNAAGSEFCGACGTYLEWEPTPAPVPGAAGQADRQAAPLPSPQRGGPPPRQSGLPPGGAPWPPPSGQGGPGQPEPGQSAAGAFTPVQPDAGQPVQPGAMRPTDRKPTAGAHRPRLTERRTPQPGDLICGQCGEANPPTRKFCARCGSTLVEAAVVAEKWWRRLLPKRTAPAAGTRRLRRAGGARRGIGKAVRWTFLVLLLVAVGLYGLVPSFRGAVDTRVASLVKDAKGAFGAELTPVRPTGITATAESPDHPPLLAADNAKNTFWLAPAEPTPPALVLDFGREVDLREAIVRVGNPDDFQAAHRPKKLHLVYSTGRTFDLSIADTPDEQRVTIEGSAGATRVEVHVVELHRSLRGADVAVAEIEFFAAG